MDETAAYVVRGKIGCGGQSLACGQMGVNSPGSAIRLRATESSHVMVIGGAPLGDRHVAPTLGGDLVDDVVGDTADGVGRVNRGPLVFRDEAKAALAYIFDIEGFLREVILNFAIDDQHLYAKSFCRSSFLVACHIFTSVVIVTD